MRGLFLGVYPVLFMLCLIGARSNAQELEAPKWDKNNISFKTAKLQKIIEKSKVDQPTIYKDCMIDFKAFNGKAVTVTVNIPDVFYIKDAEISHTTYKSEKELTAVLYTAYEGDKFISVTIFFTEAYNKPNKFLISFKDNIMNKSVPMKDYKLTEIKE